MTLFPSFCWFSYIFILVYQKLADLKALPPNKLAVCLLYFISNINLLHHEESIIVMYYKVILVSILVGFFPQFYTVIVLH